MKILFSMLLVFVMAYTCLGEMVNFDGGHSGCSLTVSICAHGRYVYVVDRAGNFYRSENMGETFERAGVLVK